MNFKFGGKDINLLQYLEERVRKNPGSSFFAMLAYFYLEIDKVPEALSVAQRGIIVHPNYSTGHIVLAMAMVRARLFADAKKELMKARDLHPDSTIAERLIAELEKDENANEIGKKLAEQFRKNSGKDIMKTVAETIKANRSRMDHDKLAQMPAIDDFAIPGLDIIVGGEHSKSRPVEPISKEGEIKSVPTEQNLREMNSTEQVPSPKVVQSENKSNSSSIARAIIDKVEREVSEQIPSEERRSSPQSERAPTPDVPHLAEPNEEGPVPPKKEEGSIEGLSDEIDLDSLARKLDAAGPIKSEKELARDPDENSSIELTPEIVTDTLAMIFEQQGQIRTAIEAYNILKKKKPAQAEFYDKKIAELMRIQQSKFPEGDAQN